MYIYPKYRMHNVVLGWIISLCVGPGIEPATFRFQSKALITPLPSLHSSSTVPKPGIEPATFRFQSKALITPLPSLRSSSTVPKPGIEPATFRFQSKALITPLPSLRSSSTFLLSLSLSLSFPLSLCFFLRFSSTCFCFWPRKKKDARKEKRVGFYLHHLTHNPFP